MHLLDESGIGVSDLLVGCSFVKTKHGERIESRHGAVAWFLFVLAGSCRRRCKGQYRHQPGQKTQREGTDPAECRDECSAYGCQPRQPEAHQQQYQNTCSDQRGGADNLASSLLRSPARRIVDHDGQPKKNCDYGRGHVRRSSRASAMGRHSRRKNGHPIHSYPSFGQSIWLTWTSRAPFRVTPEIRLMLDLRG